MNKKIALYLKELLTEHQTSLDEEYQQFKEDCILLKKDESDFIFKKEYDSEKALIFQALKYLDEGYLKNV